MKELNVFIPAAGLGKRLQPITNHIPKPLLPLLGKPLLEHVIERIAPLGITKIGINLHHLQTQVSSWLLKSKYAGQIEMFYENDLLGTGGAIRNANGLLSSSTFLVHNTDILSNIDLGMLIENHEASGNLVTLAVHDYPGLNNLRLDAIGFLKDVIKLSESQEPCESRLRQAAYTGIAVYHPDFIEHIPAGSSGMVSCWRKALASGAKIGTVDVTGSAWKDLGRPESFAEAVWDKLISQGERVFIHPKSSGCEQVTFQGMAVIESNAAITGAVTLENSIFIPGSSVDGSQKAINEKNIRNKIIGPDYSIEIPEPTVCDNIWNQGANSQSQILPILQGEQKLIEEVFGLNTSLLSVSRLSFGGSDRSYHRLRLGSRSVVLMITDKSDPDYERHLEYTIFFSRLGLPVPRLLATAPIEKSAIVKRSAIFEDLGDFSLYSWMKCRRPSEDVEDMYQKVLEIIVKMHTYSSTVNDDCLSLKFRNFDYDHLRWESSYFLREFVTNYCRQEIVDHLPLEDELHRLAIEVERHPKKIIHRDCQSQNIMITQNQKPYMPYLIDYQGARIGPPAYDLASLLWDPYVKIEENLRERLVEAYIKNRKRTEGEGFDQALFRHSILPCLLQRHMQALGAYAFLSKKKGKLYFEKFIPGALNLLQNELEQVKDNFPVLYKLVQTIQTNY